MEEKSKNKKEGNIFKSIIPKDINSMKKLISSYMKLHNYEWKIEGEQILNKRSCRVTNEEKKILKYLILKDNPNKYRPRMWLLLSGAKSCMLNNPNYYNILLNDYPEKIPQPYEKKIENDLFRSFPLENYYSDPKVLSKMRNILIAYSRRNHSIGYCQGFNFIVGRLVMVFEKEEEAFWVFVQMVENILPINYYSDMVGVIIDQVIFNKIVPKSLPDLVKHFNACNFSIDIISIQWFVSIFSQNLNLEILMLIWDILFLDGSIVIFKASIGLLKILQHDLLKTQTFEEIYEIIENKTKDINDTTSMLMSLLFRKFEFDDDFLRKNRNLLEAEVSKKIQKNKEKIKKYQIEQNSMKRKVSYAKHYNELCHRDWPICVFNNDYKEKIVQYIIFRVVNDKILIIDDYFNGRMELKKNVSNLHKFDDICVERQDHYCEKFYKNNSLNKTQPVVKANNNYLPPRDLYPEGTLLTCKLNDENHDKSRKIKEKRANTISLRFSPSKKIQRIFDIVQDIDNSNIDLIDKRRKSATDIDVIDEDVFEDFHI